MDTINRLRSLNDTKLSIIVTVYGTEQYVERCLDSILNQTLDGIEIIVVNDGSPGDIRERIKKYPSVKYCEHKRNTGLFRARITGVEKATGDYIGFVDSDDYISRDYYRTMLQKALDGGYDIVAGRTIYEDNGAFHIKNFHETAINKTCTNQDELRQLFYGQTGFCFSWHTMWNKIYKKEVWDACYPFFNAIDRHIVMTEDILFSNVIFLNAKSYAFCENEGYYYCKNKDASTNNDDVSNNSFEKKVNDITYVFEAIEKYAKEKTKSKLVLDGIDKTRDYYGRMWYNLYDNRLSKTQKEETKKTIERLTRNKQEKISTKDVLFDSFQTYYDSTVVDIKERIIDPRIKVVSFDMFDTLVYRTISKPEDLFLLLENDFESLYHCSSSFLSIRKKSEEEARTRFAVNGTEDVTLKQIYSCMNAVLKVPDDICNEMFKKETSLEIKVNKTRKKTKELYDLCIYLKKRVFVTSDMYLPKECLKKILENNGYSGVEHIILSSDCGKLKYTGHIYDELIKEASIEAKHILHIGDSRELDYNVPSKKGINCVYWPSAKDVFDNKVDSVHTNNLSKFGKMVRNVLMDANNVDESLPYRTCVSLAYNNYFDNPYRSYNGGTNFNVDPSLVGSLICSVEIFVFAFCNIVSIKSS